VDQARLEDKLNELVKEFGDAADPYTGKLAKLAEEARANREKLEKSISRLQDLLDY